jgi:hypothetical protein
MGRQNLTQPGGSSPHSRQPFQRLAVGGLLVAAMVATFFLVTPYLSQDYNAPVAQPSPTDTLPPPTLTPRPTTTPTPFGTLTTPTSFAGFTTGSLSHLALDPNDLSTWTALKWSLANSSNRFESISPDLRLLATLQDLNPQGTLMQVFVQDGGGCAPPFCQVAWVGIVFNNPDEAYQALILLNTVDNGGSVIPQFKQDARPGYPAPTPSPSQNGSGPKPSVTSFDYHWSNLFVRISVLSRSMLNLADMEKAMALVNNMYTALNRQWSHNIQIINPPAP